ncbi:MAG: hypothetical protein LBC85_03970 [Fibromonadaceae bacterium]|jgi:hypothetical protein|nr:hypothetical protein [Fibromonadaceae bacterium]
MKSVLIKKLLVFLLALGISFTTVYADDDDWDDWEEEEEAPPKRKAPPRKAPPPKKKAEDEVPSRMGLFVNFGGGQDYVGFVYDMGTGMELILGLGLNRHTFTPEYGDPTDSQIIIGVLGVKYALGKGLLDYGLGVDVRIDKYEETMNITGFPNFYTSAELTKNISLGLHAGIQAKQSEERPPGAQPPGPGKDLNIDFVTRGVITFYFM